MSVHSTHLRWSKIEVKGTMELEHFLESNGLLHTARIGKCMVNNYPEIIQHLIEWLS